MTTLGFHDETPPKPMPRRTKRGETLRTVDLALEYIKDKYRHAEPILAFVSNRGVGSPMDLPMPIDGSPMNRGQMGEH